MTESRVDQLFTKLKDVDDPFDRSHILSILYSRIAAGLEVMEAEPQDVKATNLSEIWDKANEHLFFLVEIDPEQAFSVAVELSILPKEVDSQSELVNRWIRTSGLTILGIDGNQERLDEYLTHGKLRDNLAQVLKDNIGIDVSVLKTSQDLRNPDGFTTVQAVFIGLGLEHADGDKGQEIYRLASKRTQGEDFKRIARILKSFPECEYLTERL